MVHDRSGHGRPVQAKSSMQTKNDRRSRVTATVKFKGGNALPRPGWTDHLAKARFLVCPFRAKTAPQRRYKS